MKKLHNIGENLAVLFVLFVFCVAVYNQKLYFLKKAEGYNQNYELFYAVSALIYLIFYFALVKLNRVLGWQYPLIVIVLFFVTTIAIARASLCLQS